MIESDGIDDVTIMVNSSTAKLMGANLSYANGLPPMSGAVLCAKASMLLQVRIMSTLQSWSCCLDLTQSLPGMSQRVVVLGL